MQSQHTARRTHGCSAMRSPAQAGTLTSSLYIILSHHGQQGGSSGVQGLGPNPYTCGAGNQANGT